MDLIEKLAVAAPAAGAVIVVVWLFLKHLREERRSRDAAQAKFLGTMEKLSAPITELVIEVRLLREATQARASQAS